MGKLLEWALSEVVGRTMKEQPCSHLQLGIPVEGSTVEGPETGMVGCTGRAECRPVWPSGVGEMEVGAGAEEEGGVQARGFVLNVTDSFWQI